MTALTNHQKGFRRDRAIISLVEQLGVLSTEQIECLFFREEKQNQSRTLAQRRLKKLTQKGKLKRIRESLDQPYYYYIPGQKPGQIEHRLGVAWMYAWLALGFKSWQGLHSFQMEADYKILRADAFAAIKNTVTDKFAFCFLELDLATNPFDKIKKYNQLYASENYASSWWVHLAERFPPVIVATENEGRLKTIRQKLAAENEHGLEFRVHLLSKLREVCLHGRI